VERAVFPEGHHFFRERADGFRFRQRGFDALVRNQTANLVGEQSFPMRGGTAELDRFLLVPH
jgi:hypothetical protein